MTAKRDVPPPVPPSPAPTSTDTVDTTSLNVPFSRPKLLLLAAVGVGFAALGVWLALDPTGGTAPPADLARDEVFGALATLLGGTVACFNVRRLFSSEPAVEIGPDGFTDRSSLIAAGFVPWSVVTGVSTFTMKGQTWVSVHTVDAKARAHAGGVVRSCLKTANLRLTGAAIHFSCGGLATTATRLELALREALLAHRAREAGAEAVKDFGAVPAPERSVVPAHAPAALA